MPQTKEELIKRIEELEAEVRDLNDQIAGKDAVARSSSEPGWLFKTRNPAYAGMVYGVKFVDGKGFLPKSRMNALRTMQKIVSDFQYEVQEITAAEFEALPVGKAAPNPQREFLEKVTK